MASLLAITGPITGVRLELNDETCLGRAENMDLTLPDASVSRAHAKIYRKNLSWLIEDLGSRHGTYHNRRKVLVPTPLLKNDEIMIGGSRFLFDSDFDLQTADYSDRSVYFTSPHDDTMEAPPVAVLDQAETPLPIQDAELSFIVQLGELFDSVNVDFAESLSFTCQRLRKLFRADLVLLMLWDHAAQRLRTTVALSDNDSILADSAIIHKAYYERKALLISDRPNTYSHPVPGAPESPSNRSVIATPLEIGDSMLGIIYLERFELDAYSLVELRNARAVAKLMAVFIEIRQTAQVQMLKARFALEDTEIIGHSPAIHEMLNLTSRVAPTKASVLITGETGTGKEVLAREIHRQAVSAGLRGPFVAINCSAVPETLFESALFGHEKGAFTGASRMQIGSIEQANGGTLFLDEIGELSLAMQPKLLRFLQERVFTRVGGVRPIRADVRLICATNRNLEEEVRAGRFREDLYHRISVFPIGLPPLRQRPTDIAALADHFLRIHARESNRPVVGLSAESIKLLEKYPWPGNIRELSNCIERAVLICDHKVLLPRHFQLNMPPMESPVDAPEKSIESLSGTGASLLKMADVEKSHIARVLDICGNNQIKAAEMLGIHRNTLRKKIQDYQLKA